MTTYPYASVSTHALTQEFVDRVDDGDIMVAASVLGMDVEFVVYLDDAVYVVAERPVGGLLGVGTLGHCYEPGIGFDAYKMLKQAVKTATKLAIASMKAA